MKTGLIALVVALLVAAANVALFGTLLKLRSSVSARLGAVSTELRDLGDGSVVTTVRVKQAVEVHADLRVDEPTTIDLKMDVRHRLPLKLEVKIDENLTVPLDLAIDEQIGVDGVRLRIDRTRVRAKADIPLHQAVRWRVALPLEPLLNIRGSVPLDQDIDITFPEAVEVSGKIPVRFSLQDILMVPVKFQVPVDQILDLNLPIDQRATVAFPQTLKISGSVPVEVEIPVNLPLSATPVKKHLDRLADILDGLLAF